MKPLSAGQRLGMKLFMPLFVLETAVVSIGFLPFLLFPGPLRYTGPKLWTYLCNVLLKWCCGITYSIEGKEHLPASGPVLFACKHQSVWETLIFYLIVPNPVYVLKKELLKIPVVGWYMRFLHMIAVDRKAGMRALKSLVEQAVDRLEHGFQVIIFPEGTRMPYGETGKYHSGIAAIYERSGQPVYPVSLDSGRFWPKTGELKPGPITMRIHPPIVPGLPKAEFMAVLQEKVESC